MASGDLIGWLLAVLLVSLRVSPVFAFAPPFTLTRLPPQFRMIFGLGLSACMVAAHPEFARAYALSTADLVAVAAKELLLGFIFVLAFQIAFGSLYLAGRTVDIQAGFGLALLIDPTSRAQSPLVGTLFALGAGAVFFGMNGHLDLLRIMAASYDAVPLGAGGAPRSLGRLLEFIAGAFMISFGVAGAAMLCLFLTDLAIALMARTVPQMNVLVLGFQVKTVVLLLILPLSFGASGALLARLMRLTLEALPALL